MFNQLKRMTSIILVVIMIFALGACNKNNNASSEVEVIVENVYEYVSGESKGDDTPDASSQTDSSSKTSSNSSGNKVTTVNKNVDPKKYAGTTVRYATWKDPELDEDGPVVKAFEKKYNINVDIDLINQGNYVNIVTGMIASGDSPDVFFCHETFPSALSCLQPIDGLKLDLNENIWEKGILDVTKINGKSYLVNTVGNIWNEVDCVYYNKKLLSENNITTPEEYYKAGKWDIKALEKIMTEVKSLGSDYIGGYIDWETYLNMHGVSFYKWQNGKFSNGATDAKVTECCRTLATWLKNGLVRGMGTSVGYREDFALGKTGIAITDAYGLKKTGCWRSMNPDHIGFTYLPNIDGSKKSKTSGTFRGWGLMKGSKNPVGAGIFLRYYLDVNNYDTNTAFINSDASSFFFKLTNGVEATDKSYSFSTGAQDITGQNSYALASPTYTDPNQVAQKISSMQNELNANVKKINNFIAQQTK